MSRAQLLLAQTDQVYGRLRQRLEGLTDDEYFWEPGPGAGPSTVTRRGLGVVYRATAGSGARP